MAYEDGDQSLFGQIKERLASGTDAFIGSVQDLSAKLILGGFAHSWALWHRYEWARYARNFWYPATMYHRVATSDIWANLTYDTWRLYRSDQFAEAQLAARNGEIYNPDPGIGYAAYNDLLLLPFLVLEILYIQDEMTVLRILANDGRVYSLFLRECSSRPELHFEKVRYDDE